MRVRKRECYLLIIAFIVIEGVLAYRLHEHPLTTAIPFIRTVDGTKPSTTPRPTTTIPETVAAKTTPPPQMTTAVVTPPPSTIRPTPPSSPPSPNAHVFYYPWYGAPSVDGKWLHWNHNYLPHWDQSVTDRYPKGRHKPPLDIGASYYPYLGPYSSRNLTVIDLHMQYMAMAAIGVCVLSWYPPGSADNEGLPSDNIVLSLLDAAQRNGITIAFHSEPYENRNGPSFERDVHYIVDTYGKHPALHRIKGRVVMYVYDAYHTPIEEWNSAMRRLKANPSYACFAIALYLHEKDDVYITQSDFDGVYTYFASHTFTFGSNLDHWNSIATLAAGNNKIFIPSVGPGYDDVKVRPWNSENTYYRKHGQYYNDSFNEAIRIKSSIVSITSFNEWHEGTQIEPAMPVQSYHDYQPQDPFYYLHLTAFWVGKIGK
jgi:glycoprotein endo-alpha-1,2-mannosidase